MSDDMHKSVSDKFNSKPAFHAEQCKSTTQQVDTFLRSNTDGAQKSGAVLVNQAKNDAKSAAQYDTNTFNSARKSEADTSIYDTDPFKDIGDQISRNSSD